jgi:hypothetical protein
LKDARPEQLHDKICSQFRCPSSSVVVETGASTSPAPAPCAAPFSASEEVSPSTVSSSSFAATYWKFRLHVSGYSLKESRIWPFWAFLRFPEMLALLGSTLRFRLWLGPLFP